MCKSWKRRCFSQCHYIFRTRKWQQTSAIYLLSYFCLQTHPCNMCTELSALRIEAQTFTTYLCLRFLLSKTELSSKREKNIKGLFLHFAIFFLNIHIHSNIRFVKQDAKLCMYYDYIYVKNVVARNPLTLYSWLC